MALSRACCRGALWRLGPGPGLSRAWGPLGPLGPRPARGAPRSPVCCLSTKAGSRSILAALASKAKRINGRYERFLERTFPRFYVLYATFTKGIQALFLEVKEIRKIKSKMSRQRLSVQQLPYREMERLRQFRRDVIKAIPIGIIAIPPFANFLVIVLMYFFPRQLLIRYFWTPNQQVEFLDAYDAIRRDSYPDVVESLALAARFLPEPQLRKRLRELCAEVQQGSQPRVAELYAVRSLFSGSPLGLNKLQVSHVASPAEPRLGDPEPGPRHAAPGLGPDVRGGAESGLLPPWPELHSSRHVRVQSVAGAVAGALLQAASFRSIPPGEQHGPAVPQLRPGQGVTAEPPAAHPHPWHRAPGDSQPGAAKTPFGDVKPQPGAGERGPDAAVGAKTRFPPSCAGGLCRRRLFCSPSCRRSGLATPRG
ncbi:LETM1 domain-containing protein 1 isoform X1 [Calonectris borealis]|uniref:LETM1 domain-containing protein 1 isoform X1 n=1 Tax=Calonectris borealis TaxID=1323832 RepID=UPI003F4C20D0